MAQAARFVGMLVQAQLTGAVFARKIEPDTPHRLLVIDEFQELLAVKGATEELGRLWALARFKRCGLWVANQSASQLDAKLLALMKDNIVWHAAFRPTPADIKPREDMLAVSGSAIDPDDPGKLLSRRAEKRALISRLGRLPPRHALFSNTIATTAQVYRTLSVPGTGAEERARRAPKALREAMTRGVLAEPIEKLLEEAKPRELAPPLGEAPKHPPAAKRKRKSRRPPLELP
jgi:hypothetical protein